MNGAKTQQAATRILRHSTLPMTMRYTHLRKLSRAAQGAFLRRFGRQER